MEKSQDFWLNFIQNAPNDPAFPTRDGLTPKEIEAEEKIKVLKSLDLKLIEQGQECFERNFGAMMFGLIATALMGFSVKSTTGVLLRNSNFLLDTKESIDRNLSTLRHILRWHRSDFCMEKVIEQLFVVRRIHGLVLKNIEKPGRQSSTLAAILENNSRNHEAESRLAEAIRLDLAYVDTTLSPACLTTYDPEIPMSQFNMVCTLATGFAFIKIHAPHFGITDTTGMEGLMHLWAVVGRALGIKDDYNIPMHDDLLDSQLSKRFIDSIVLAGLKSCDTPTIIIHQYILQGLANWFPFPVSHKGMLLLCFTTFSPEFTGENLKKLMTSFDFIWVYTMRLALHLIGNYWIFSVVAKLINEWYIGAAFSKYLGRDGVKIVNKL